MIRFTTKSGEATYDNTLEYQDGAWVQTRQKHGSSEPAQRGTPSFAGYNALIKASGNNPAEYNIGDHVQQLRVRDLDQISLYLASLRIPVNKPKSIPASERRKRSTADIAALIVWAFVAGAAGLDLISGSPYSGNVLDYARQNFAINKTDAENPKRELLFDKFVEPGNQPAYLDLLVLAAGAGLGGLRYYRIRKKQHR